nr:PREDICTED: uncharacterized protein LOC106489447 [Apteryx mantelli mantelli]
MTTETKSRLERVIQGLGLASLPGCRAPAPPPNPAASAGFRSSFELASRCWPVPLGFADTDKVEKDVATLDSRLREGCGTAGDNMPRLSALEQKLAKVNFKQEILTFRFTTIQTHVFKLRAQGFNGLNLTSQMAQNRGRSSIPQHAMRFPAELMKDIQAGEVEQKLICIYIHSPCIFQDARNSSVLNDHILGAFLQNVRVTNLSQPVEIQFQHNKVLDSSNAICVFWLDGAGGKGLGSWSSEGCETRHSQGTVLCLCNHLTYFAVLLITPGDISQAELVSLTYISIVGCSISAAASLFILLFYCIFRRKKSDDTTKIHMNLLGALFLLNSGFLLSEPLALASVGLCQATAAFLHGCLLCTFAWMAAEAFHLYLLLIKVYNIYVRRYLLKLCLFGWGLPALVVISILLFKKDTYGYLDIKVAQNRGRSSIPQHAMRFPAELMKDIQAGEVEQKLICIYIHSPCIFQDARNSSVLNDHILGAFLRNVRVTNLSQPVEIQFQHNKVLDSSNAICVFWLDGAGGKGLGSWSSEGCETRHSQGTVLCLCNHLTYFAVLLITPGDISQAELVSLTYISIVGCSISAAASLFILLFYCIFRRKKSDDTTKIHMNLLGALFLLNSGFLLSEPLALASVGLCQATAAFLHGCLLCTFAWMAAEAFHLYLLLIKVYNIYVRRYLLKLCLFGWGLPALVVISILLFKKDTYGYLDIKVADGYKNATMCWLTSRAAHNGTLCYAGLILLFNTLVLLIVVRILRSSRRQTGTARKDWATVLGLTCLLGVTWGLAFFSFGVFFVPQLYLFTILNSLQDGTRFSKIFPGSAPHARRGRMPKRLRTVSEAGAAVTGKAEASSALLLGARFSEEDHLGNGCRVIASSASSPGKAESAGISVGIWAQGWLSPARLGNGCRVIASSASSPGKAESAGISVGIWAQGWLSPAHLGNGCRVIASSASSPGKAESAGISVGIWAQGWLSPAAGGCSSQSNRFANNCALLRRGTPGLAAPAPFGGASGRSSDAAPLGWEINSHGPRAGGGQTAAPSLRRCGPTLVLAACPVSRGPRDVGVHLGGTAARRQGGRQPQRHRRFLRL